MLYNILVNVFEKIEMGSSARIELSALFSETPQSEWSDMAYLCSSTFAPEYKGLELGVGDTMIIKAISMAFGSNIGTVKKQHVEIGDLGKVAQELRGKMRTLGGLVKPKPLTAGHVLSTYKNICGTKGTVKLNLIIELLVSANPLEVRYIVRGLQGNLRCKMGVQTVLIALALASNKDQEFVKKCYNRRPVLPDLIQALINETLDEYDLELGIPVRPMLAVPTKEIPTINEFVLCEYKYDGERAQFHGMPNGSIRCFSRNMEDTTEKFPDAIEQVRQAVNSARNFIVDTEIVAWDTKTSTILPFQVLANRPRKNVSLDDIKIPVMVVIFDLLYLDDESHLESSTFNRIMELQESFESIPGKCILAQGYFGGDVNEHMKEAIEAKCEGLMIKELSEPYEPSKRSTKWNKLKKDYLSTVGDTLDLVPVGAFYGQGGRSGVYGAYFLAVYNEDEDEYVGVCKIGTGFSNEQLENFYKQFSSVGTSTIKPSWLTANVDCDIWFEFPTQVWEVKAADYTISPTYAAGVSLRFPRLIRVRHDLDPKNATTTEQLVTLYQKQ